MFRLVQPELSKIKKYRDIHKGEACYIFGDGVSLKWFDLEHFSDHVGIAAGLIPFHSFFSKLDVRYLLLVEPFWFYPAFWTNNITNSTSMPVIQAEYRKVISSHPEKTFFLNLSNYPVISDNNVIYLFRDFSDKSISSNFITRRINAFHGSLRAAITLAIYMGFSKCYLVGCDYTHNPTTHGHWYEVGKGVEKNLDSYNSDYFEIAREFIDIVTVTNEAQSKILDSITYKDLTGQEPFFKENIELLRAQTIKVLSSWPGYKMK